ncbi:MAG: hypothetical protein E7052_07885 [Lentisphaerae bacterium]|nr:hypothetical protein [Lentisphaerota bacterium]
MSELKDNLDGALNNDVQTVEEKSKFGCAAYLGLLLLLAAVLSVVFFLLIKPMLEDRGVDLDSHWSDLSQRTSAAVNAFKSGGETIADNAGEKLDDAAGKVRDAAEKAEEVSENVAQKTAPVKEKVAEKVEPVKEKIEEKVESWY